MIFGQAKMMTYAVENLGARLLLADELTAEADVAAALTGMSRGCRLICSVHGATLAEVIRCPQRRKLFGGTKSVTLSDKTALAESRRGGSGDKQQRTSSHASSSVITFDIWTDVAIT